MTRAREIHAQWRALPCAGDDRLLRSGRAMILAPHADDETLGCGGLIAELCAAGRPPVVLVITDGTGSHPNSRLWPPERLRRLREDEALRATALLGLRVCSTGFLGLRDTAAPREGEAFERACGAIAAASRRHGCDTVLAPWLGDPHCDHLAVQTMARQVSRALGLRLLSYPVWGWLIAAEAEIAAEAAGPRAPARGFRLDITRHLARKRRAIRQHASQYAGLITDDPQGFQLPDALLSVFEQPSEFFLETS